MENFTYWNPVKIVFGQGMIAQLDELIGADANVLMTYGGGSIKRNGVYEQVTAALGGRSVGEFGGIEPNPRYRTCLKAIEQARGDGADFLLAVGGGSVLDATKFIAAALRYDGEDPWSIMLTFDALDDAVPLGCVLTLPATGSEMNGNAVVSRDDTKEKLFFKSTKVMPQFSILDPSTTFTLPDRQTANGVVDAYVHVMEQYMTVPGVGPLQDRQAEAVLRTLIENGPVCLAQPDNYDARANVMWSATNALNGLLSCGVPGDWASHRIGHDITALHGLDHAQTLACLLPAVMKHLRAAKLGKLVQYAERVWQVTEGDDNARADAAIERTETFFRDLGVATKLGEYGVPAESIDTVVQRQFARDIPICGHVDIEAADVEAILKLAM